MKPPLVLYERPATVAETLALLAEHGDEARVLAGGQSLVPLLNLRLSSPGVIVDINGLFDLSRIEEGPDGLMVGAITRQRQLETAPEAAGFGALADGLPLIGHVATRNRGTVGGSVAHADPGAELPLALLALGGSAVAESTADRREIPAEGLFTGPFSTTLHPGELLVEIRFPAAGPGEGSAMQELAQRHGDFALAAAAVWVRLDAGRDRCVAARVAVGAVASRPVLMPEAAAALVVGADPAEVGRLCAGTVEAVGSLHAPPDYQRHLVGVLVARAVRRAVDRAREAPDDAHQEVRHGSPSGFRAEPTTASGEAGLPPSCRVNGRPVSLEGVPSRRLLSDFLRHDLGLRGTHVGCEHGVCGACTVRLDGAAVRSCLLLAVQADGARIDTVEGLAGTGPGGDRPLHPLQDAFRRHFALQCGFCTPGILMSAAERYDAAGRSGAPTETEIRQLLSGHLCRCTGYEPIVSAVAEAISAAALNPQEDPTP